MLPPGELLGVELLEEALWGKVKESVNSWRVGPGWLPSSSGRPGSFSSLFYILCAEWVAPLIKGCNGLFSMSTHSIRFKRSKGRTHRENYVFLPSSPHEWAHLQVPFTRDNVCIDICHCVDSYSMMTSYWRNDVVGSPVLCVLCLQIQTTSAQKCSGEKTLQTQIDFSSSSFLNHEI